MGIFDKLYNEFIDIIEWLDDSRNTLVWRFPRYQNEIKNGAKLVVRPGQKAIFVNKGQIADVFEEGMHTLSTENMPVMSTIMGWKYGFNSPFKAEVYFVSTRQITELKWGTPNPIMMRDPEFGPIRIRAFGTYSLRALDEKALLRELVGTDHSFETGEINELMRSIINTVFAEVIGSSNIPVLDLAASYQKLSDKLRAEVCERIDDEYGLEVTQLNIVNISLPEAVEKALDNRTSMGVLGDMGKYQQYQMAESMTLAAQNQGGGAASGMGMGMGFAMANQMANSMGAQQQQPGFGAPSQQTAPPPPPPAPAFYYAENGQTKGPFPLQNFAAAISAGQITPDTMVWAQGMPQWVPAKQVPQLAQYFQAAPPPPPPT